MISSIEHLVRFLLECNGEWEARGRTVGIVLFAAVRVRRAVRLRVLRCIFAVSYVELFNV